MWRRRSVEEVRGSIPPNKILLHHSTNQRRRREPRGVSRRFHMARCHSLKKHSHRYPSMCKMTRYQPCQCTECTTYHINYHVLIVDWSTSSSVRCCLPSRLANVMLTSTPVPFGQPSQLRTLTSHISHYELCF